MVVQSASRFVYAVCVQLKIRTIIHEMRGKGEDPLSLAFRGRVMPVK